MITQEKEIIAREFPSKAEWMQSKEYRVLRRRIFASQEFQCKDCSKKTIDLELHHERYPQDNPRNHCEEKHGRGWGSEEDDDVVGLCRGCHHQRHVDINGKFWANVQDMEDYWWGYWNELEKD